MDLKKISDEDLWERLLGMVQDPCVAMASKIMDEIDRRITETEKMADQLRACLDGDDYNHAPLLARGLLRSKMSALSEEHYAAEWLDGTGIVLWGMLGGEPRDWGMQTVSEETLQLLRTLAFESGGWWQDDKTFVPLAEWWNKQGAMTFNPLSDFTEANALADRLAAEAGAARKLIVALRDIIRDYSVVIPMKVSVAQKLKETVDEYEKCAIAINAAGDLGAK
jgi:hypothetical protein